LYQRLIASKKDDTLHHSDGIDIILQFVLAHAAWQLGDQQPGVVADRPGDSLTFVVLVGQRLKRQRKILFAVEIDFSSGAALGIF
jgi:hypothetical protein